MNNLHLLEAIGEIQEEHIESARLYHAPRQIVRRLTAMAAALLLLCTGTLTTLAAADVDPAYDMLYALSPAIAQQLKPVNLFCENNGIRMEVVSAQLEDTEAHIYISLQDLTGSRVDESIDLFDSYSLRVPAACEGSCSQVSFNPDTQTATFLLHLTFEDPLFDGKVTFHLREFLSGKDEFDGPLTQIDLSAVSRQPARIPLDDERIRGYGAFGRDNPYLYPNWSGYGLAPDMNGFSSVDGVRITAMGVTEGMLLLQTHYENILESDNHGYLYLTDASGQKIEGEASLSYWDEPHTGSFQEQVFAVDTDNLSQYTLHGSFTTCDSLTQGDWEITIPLN